MKKFQPVNHQETTYNRPNDKWLCGRLKDGCPCRFGPSQDGKCRSTTECVPIIKNGEWFCTRNKNDGGKCPNGPTPDGKCCINKAPCNPTRNLRSFRGLLTIGCIIATVAMLLVILNIRQNNKYINPGPLTYAHAQTEQQCSACHIFQADDVHFNSNNHADGQRCLSCHDIGSNAFHAHGLPKEKLSELNSSRTQNTDSQTASLFLKLAKNENLIEQGLSGDLSCNTCHKEHHGRNNNLSNLTNQQCQICHEQQFESLANGHPEFTQYPYQKRTAIIFDHDSHLNEHFLNDKNKELAPTSCASCHSLDISGRSMLTQSFERSCASCHADQISGAGRAGELGLEFFKVPSLDVVTLKENGISIGDWPEYAEGTITPFMIFLLKDKYIDQKNLNKIGKLDMLDLRNASNEELLVAEKYAWAIKELLFDLLVNGHELLADRISKNNPIRNSKDFLDNRMAASLSFEIISAVQKNWFPDLVEEVPNYRKGIKPILKNAKDLTENSPIESETVNLDLNSENIENNDSLIDLNDSTSDLLELDESNNDSNLLGESSTENSDLLLNDNLDENLLTEIDDDNTLLDENKLLDTDLDSEELTTNNSDSNFSTQATDNVEIKPNDSWVSFGGWYRNDSNYTLHYRPTGHEDTFIKSWVDISMQNKSNYKMFSKLMNKDSVGQCSKCHSVDKINDETFKVNWLAASIQKNSYDFNKFKHAPHIKSANNNTCVTCHKIDSQINYAKSFQKNNDPHKFLSNFSPMLKNACTECHKPDVTSDSCLQCHKYHAGNFIANFARNAELLKGN